jgi:predicted dehydrogenase
MRNVNGSWEYDLTKAEARLVEGFMGIYAPAFETARAEFAAGRIVSRRLRREI